MSWQRITKEMWKTLHKTNRGKLVTIEYEQGEEPYPSYLWIEGFDLQQPFIKMEVNYMDFDDPVKYWKWDEINTDSLRAIFLKGWMSSDIIAQYQKDFIDIWLTAALEAEQDGFQLTIFRIPTALPYKADPEAVEEIERLLQQKYPQYANKKPTKDH